MAQEIEKFYLLQEGENVITNDLIEEFKKRNPELQPFLEKHNLELRPLKLDYFESWIYWIISQQLNGRVADLLINRFRTLCKELTPTKVLEIPDQEFRSIGISKSKTEYLKNIALFHQEKKNIENFEAYSSDQIRKIYTKVRGIGPWTVDMFLIFNLNRLDILATHDLVVRKGIKRMYNLKDVPSIKMAEKIGGKWGDLATLGTLLAWEIIGD
ncbi:MAG: DNA-3-methyladenine glycosylase 2 family protein [Methanobacteriota archaeon]|nr:MAG: DNA-3-methyladenine glycosylase 2 family protein [Euryarchaeota archaeon]